MTQRLMEMMVLGVIGNGFNLISLGFLVYCSPIIDLVYRKNTTSHQNQSTSREKTVAKAMCMGCTLQNARSTISGVRKEQSKPWLVDVSVEFLKTIMHQHSPRMCQGFS